MQDGLTIRGVTDPLITAAVEVDAVVLVEAARQVTLDNFSVDAAGLAEEGVRIDSGSVAEIENLTVVNAQDGNVTVFGASLARLVGGNIIGDSNDDTGMLVGGNATVIIFGANTLNAEYGALDCEFAGVVMQEGEGPDEMLTVNGHTSIVETCMVFISNGTLNGNIQMQQNSSLTLEPEENNSSIVTAGEITMSQSSSILVDQEGGAVTIGGGTVFLLNSSFTMRGGTLQSSLQLHAASRAELLYDAVSPTGTDVIQLHSFSSLSSNQTVPLTANEVVCFGANSGFHSDDAGNFTDLCAE